MWTLLINMTETVIKTFVLKFSQIKFNFVFVCFHNLYILDL